MLHCLERVMATLSTSFLLTFVVLLTTSVAIEHGKGRDFPESETGLSVK